MNDTLNLIARLLLAQIFILAGLTKLGTGYAGTEAYMASMGVPALLLPAVIALEVGGGLALAVGLMARPAAAALAVFTLLAACIFHNHFADSMQMILFMKNLAITGGLLMVVAYGGGRLSLDALRARS